MDKSLTQVNENLHLLIKYAILQGLLVYKWERKVLSLENLFFLIYGQTHNTGQQK